MATRRPARISGDPSSVAAALMLATASGPWSFASARPKNVGSSTPVSRAARATASAIGMHPAASPPTASAPDASMAGSIISPMIFA